MHLVACSCLNVKIFAKTDIKNSKPAVIEPLPDHHFFTNHSIHEVALHIQGIQIEHNYLVERTNVEGWTVHKCINCVTLTHAKHSDNDMILVDSDLVIDKAEINKLVSSPNYSSLYKIIIEKPPTAVSNTAMSDNVSSILQSIQLSFEEYIKKEEVELNVRIRKFEAAEKEKFDEMKLKFMQEKNTLLSVIVNNDSKKVCFQLSSEEEIPSKMEEPIDRSKDLPPPEVDIPDVLPSIGLPDDGLVTVNSPVDIKPLTANKLFGALNREYSPILSPLSFGVSGTIPEEDEEGGDNDAADCYETDFENESDNDFKLMETKYPKDIASNENAVLKRTEKLVSRPRMIEVANVSHKLARPVGKLMKQDADRVSVGSLDPEDVFLLNSDFDDQRGDPSTNFTSDEDDVLQGRTGVTEDDEQRSSSALYSTSVPIRVPLSLRQISRDVDVTEDTPSDAESMAASILALARSCHGDTEIFGELPRPRVKTPRLHQTSLGKSLDDNPLAA